MVGSASLFGCAAGELQPDPADPGDPGRGAADHGAQRHRAVEAGGARPGAHRPPTAERPSSARRGARSPRSGRALRLLVAVGLGTAAFSMQDILLEPYGGQILQLGGRRDDDADGAAGGGALVGVRARRAPARATAPIRIGSPRSARWPASFAFAAVIFAAPLESAFLFRVGAILIGFGGGLFAVGTLTAAMALRPRRTTAAWRSAPGARCRRRPPASPSRSAASCATSSAASPRSGALGAALAGPGVGYSVVYHIEIALLFATLVAIGPLVRARTAPQPQSHRKFRPGRISRLAHHVPRRNRHANRRHHPVHRCRPGRALRVLDLLRRCSSSTCAARTSARAIRSSPIAPGDHACRAGLPMPAAQDDSCSRGMAQRAARRADTRPRGQRRADRRRGPARRSSRPAIRCATASAPPPMPSAPTRPT